MKKINCPHDKLFKQSMKDIRIAKDFLKNYLPEKILKLINLDTLKPCSISFINEALESSYSDVLFEVKLGGQKSYIYCLCEHLSRVNKLMPLACLEYMTCIWREDMKLTGKKVFPLVIPIVFYHGKKVYNGPRDIREMILGPSELIEEFLFKPFHLIDTHDIEDETLRNQYWSGVLSFVMKHIFDRDFLPHFDILEDMLDELKNKGIDVSSFSTTLFLYIITTRSTKSHARLLERVTNKQSKLRGKFMNAGEFLRNEGRLEIRIEAQQAALNMMEQMIQSKFGFVPNTYFVKLKKMDYPDLLSMGQKVLKAQSLQELFVEECSV